MKKVKSIKAAKSIVKDMKISEGIEEVYVSYDGYVYYSSITAEARSKGNKVFTVKIN